MAVITCDELYQFFVCTLNAFTMHGIAIAMVCKWDTWSTNTYHAGCSVYSRIAILGVATKFEVWNFVFKV